MREEVKWWIDDAYRSFEIARENYTRGFYEVTVFYCQQTLEKLFKGSIIALKKGRPIKTHKLIRLYNKVAQIVPLSDDLTDFLHIVSPYYFTSRYPDIAMGLPIEVITKDFAVDCIKKTGRILQCFKKKLSKEK